MSADLSAPNCRPRTVGRVLQLGAEIGFAAEVQLQAELQAGDAGAQGGPLAEGDIGYASLHQKATGARLVLESA
ncbi:MAG TPA: hypothetical protein VJ578_03265 [Dehalococcoidia bacterium]|nr:hypothetical protein [Dehalococcoidia bacterium]